MDCDRISELPESLLTQILSYLPTKDSVKTSLLSKRWEFVWLSVPVLDLNANDLPVHNCKVFESFVDKFLELNHDSRMQKFKIENHLWGYTYNRVEEWIGAAVDCGIQHLDVATRMGPYMPHNFYKSNTLVSLKLVFIGIKDPEFVVALPCLKIMHLEDVWYELDPSNLEKLISGCPALEDLIVIKTIGDFNDDEDVMPLQFLRVRSQTLKIFRLMFKHCLYDEDYSVEIDAPRLEYLCFNDNQSDKIVIKNLNSLFMIDLDTEFMIETGSNFLIKEDSSKRDTIHDFLTGISSVRHMIISQLTLKVLYLYSEFGPIPKFVNLYRLDAAFSSSTLQLLPVFFESCPNLKILILDYDVSAQPEQVDLSYVPRCLISTLECVAINKLIMKEETGIKLVNYFIGNSAVLKRLTVSFTGSSKTYRLVPRAIYIQEPYCNYIY